MTVSKSVITAVCVLSFVGIESSWAYIPPSWFLIQNMTSKRKGLKSLRTSSTVMAFDSGKPTGIHFRATSIYVASTRTWKSVASDDTGTQLFSIERKDSDLPLSWLVLFDPSARNLEQTLKKIGVPITEPGPVQYADPNAKNTDGSTNSSGNASATAKKNAKAKANAANAKSAQVYTGKSDGEVDFNFQLPEPPKPEETETLKRWNGSVAWVIGTKDTSQFWVEKDSFLPSRLIFKDQDYQYSKYRYSQDLPYPREIDLAKITGEVVYQESLGDFSVNSAMAMAGSLKSSTDKSADAFEVNAEAGADGAFTPAGDSVSSSLKELIKKYYGGNR